MSAWLEWLKQIFRGPSPVVPGREVNQPTPEDDDGWAPDWDFQHCIQPHPQLTSYSCAAAALQCVSQYFGTEMSHAKAVRLTRCNPNGATVEKVATLLKRHQDCSVRRVRDPEVMRRALVRGCLILAGDRLTYTDDHFIVIYGCDESGFYIMDPAADQCVWRSEAWMFEAGEEFFAVRLRRASRRASSFSAAVSPRWLTLLKWNGIAVFDSDARLVSLLMDLPLEDASSWGRHLFCQIPRERRAEALQCFVELGIGVVWIK